MNLRTTREVDYVIQVGFHGDSTIRIVDGKGIAGRLLTDSLLIREPERG